jgi:hypothetical protein
MLIDYEDFIKKCIDYLSLLLIILRNNNTCSIDVLITLKSIIRGWESVLILVQRGYLRESRTIIRTSMEDVTAFCLLLSDEEFIDKFEEYKKLKDKKSRYNYWYENLRPKVLNKKFSRKIKEYNINGNFMKENYENHSSFSHFSDHAIHQSSLFIRDKNIYINNGEKKINELSLISICSELSLYISIILNFTLVKMPSDEVIKHYEQSNVFLDIVSNLIRDFKASNHTSSHSK